MRDPEQFARRPSVVRRGFRIPRGPFEQNLVVRVAVASGTKSGVGVMFVVSA